MFLLFFAFASPRFCQVVANQPSLAIVVISVFGWVLAWPVCLAAIIYGLFDDDR